MKNIIITVCVILTISIASLSYRTPFIDDLLEQNIDALSQVEEGAYLKCYDSIMSDPTEYTMYCQICEEIPGRWYNIQNFCKPR